MSHFHDAHVDYEGKRYHFPASEGQALEGGSAYWHAPGDPSSWLAVLAFHRARELVEEAPQDVALALAAGALGCTVQELVASIRWHESYMRWHDGDPDYTILDEEGAEPDDG